MSLTLKYRPRDFMSMVWQVFIRETLSEAVKNQKLVWAYLFCWPRGTWKTSTARILAKSINCLNQVDWNPCHICDICRAISDNRLIDIIEIDAASYTWVDNIRDIIEKAQFMPNIAKYKVYIIDEVHMLTTGAFNALLKILEEPPSHVKFILATTEIHKIPETILSRCQRYDFKSISFDDIKERLKYIAKNENIEIDEKSLAYISKNSLWWLRNAISLFEQLIIDSNIKYENIIENLWITEADTLALFLSKLIWKDISIVEDYENITSSGKNTKLFFKDLLYFIRDEIIQNIKLWKDVLDLNEILTILDETYTKTKNSMDEKITFLSWLIRVINRWNTVKTEQKTIHYPKTELVTDLTPIKKVEVEKKSEIKNEDISHEDIIDIFSLSDEKQIMSSTIEEDKLVGEVDVNWFNKEKLAAKAKELWVKWAIVLWIKWWLVSFNWKVLHIKTTSKFALAPFQDARWKELILEAMEKLWFSNISLKVE